MLSRKLIKYIQSLKQKKFRESEHAFVAEGPKIVLEFLAESTYACQMIVGTEEWFDNFDQKSMLDGIEVLMVDETMLTRLSNLTTANKVLGVFDKTFLAAQPAAGNITLALDGIKDPGNMGTIIRLADWYGLPNIVCSEDCVECFNPKVIQASMGSLARVGIIYTSLENYITETGKAVYAATLNGNTIPQGWKIQDAILVIGNESTGIRAGILDLSDEEISIPRYGKAESLNAAVATGILLNQIMSAT